MYGTRNVEQRTCIQCETYELEMYPVGHCGPLGREDVDLSFLPHVVTFLTKCGKGKYAHTPPRPVPPTYLPHRIRSHGIRPPSAGDTLLLPSAQSLLHGTDVLLPSAQSLLHGPSYFSHGLPHVTRTPAVSSPPTFRVGFPPLGRDHSSHFRSNLIRPPWPT